MYTQELLRITVGTLQEVAINVSARQSKNDT
jgi:hypothetical protein